MFLNDIKEPASDDFDNNIEHLKPYIIKTDSPAFNATSMCKLLQSIVTKFYLSLKTTIRLFVRLKKHNIWYSKTELYFAR